MTDAGRCHRAKTSAPAQRVDDRNGSNNDGRDENRQTGSNTSWQRLVTPRLKRANQCVVRLWDGKRETRRKLEARLREATAMADELEAELQASHAFACLQLAATNGSIPKCDMLYTALSELSRLTEEVERQLDAAQRQARAGERRARATERRAETARRPSAERGAEQRSVLSSAVADLQGVMSPSFADLRIDLLLAAAEKLKCVLDTMADERTDGHCDRDDVSPPARPVKRQ